MGWLASTTKNSSGRITANTEVTPKRQKGGYFRIAHHPPTTSQWATLPRANVSPDFRWNYPT
jgi:hypothetical protein